MRVWIDQDLCTGDGVCTDHCPEVFRLLEDGRSYVREPEHRPRPARASAASASVRGTRARVQRHRCGTRVPRRAHPSRRTQPMIEWLHSGAGGSR